MCSRSVGKQNRKRQTLDASGSEKDESDFEKTPATKKQRSKKQKSSSKKSRSGVNNDVGDELESYDPNTPSRYVRICCNMSRPILSSPHSAAKRLHKRTKTREEFSQEAADAATLEGYCRTAVHDFAPHPTGRKQFMYWGSKVPEAACLMLVQRYDGVMLCNVM